MIEVISICIIGLVTILVVDQAASDDAARQQKTEVKQVKQVKNK